VLRVGPIIVVDVISKVMIEAIPLSGRGAPSCGRKGEATVILGGGRDGIGILVVADGLGVGGDGRLLGLIID